jgi:hypothetical protein
MKSLGRIFSLLVASTLILVTGCATFRNGTEERKQLNEPRIKPLAESVWTEEQRKVINNYKMEDGHFPN